MISRSHQALKQADALPDAEMTQKQTSRDTDPLDFSPGLLEAVNEPPSPLPRVMLYTLFLLLLLVIVWAFFGQLDIVARAQGKLIPQTRIKVVQPLEGGRVSRILVKEGQLVKADQSLLQMDMRLSDADTEKLKIELAAASLQFRRVEKELQGEELKPLSGDDMGLFSQVLAQYHANREEYLHAVGQQQAILETTRQEIAAAREVYNKLKETLPIVIKSEEAVRKLSKKGYVSKMDLMERERARIETQRDFSAQKFRIQALEAKINESQEKLKQLETAHHQELVMEQIQLSQEISQLKQDTLKQDYRNELMELKAPQAGYVKDLATNTEGTVIPAGSVILNIVPVDEPLQAEVYVDNKDVGFITAGQTVKIKLMSYEFQKYGMIDAIVENVSADANNNASGPLGAGEDMSKTTGYRTIIVLNRQYLERGGKRFVLRPGMQVTAEIKLGSRSVIEYVLSPIQKAVNEAATER